MPAGGAAPRRSAVHPRGHARRADRARQAVVLRRDAARRDLGRPRTLPNTNVAEHRQPTNNKRGEIKLTGTAASNHTIQGGYLNNSTEQATVRPSASRSTRSPDRRSHAPELVRVRQLPRHHPQRPARRGAVLAAEVPVQGLRRHQHGHRRLAVLHADISGSGTGHYNAPYFDATDPENRNNQQITGNLTYFMNTRAARPSRDQGRLRVVPQPAHRRQLAVVDRLRVRRGLPRPMQPATPVSTRTAG